MKSETILPLFDTPAHPDAWHRVTAPGGYERWHFDAEDESSPLHVVAAFIEGPSFHGEYLRQYERYLRRPTRRSPPQAREYPCVHFAAYEKGRLLAQFMSQYPPDTFAASTARPDVRIGTNTFRRNEDGSLRLELSGLEPAPPQAGAAGAHSASAGPALSGELTFRPLLETPPFQRRLDSPIGTVAEHHWVIANPLCRVEGTIRLGPTGGNGAATSRVIPFAGRGYHDHSYGTAPIGERGPGRQWWMRGRLLGADRALALHILCRRGAGRADDAPLIEIDAAAGARETASSCTIQWHRAAGPVYPEEIAFANGLRLASPRVIDAVTPCLRITYADAEMGTWLCEAEGDVKDGLSRGRG